MAAARNTQATAEMAQSYIRTSQVPTQAIQIMLNNNLGTHIGILDTRAFIKYWLHFETNQLSMRENLNKLNWNCQMCMKPAMLYKGPAPKHIP